jgi:hypothetical protein
LAALNGHNPSPFQGTPLLGRTRIVVVPQIFERHLSAWGVVLILILMLLLWPHKPRADVGEAATLPTQNLILPL